MKLTTIEQKAIVSELQAMQQLREVLDIVEIVMGFLSSGGASADKSLKDYISNALRMECTFSTLKASSLVCVLYQTINV